jgi:NAD(P)-dependent dehydrogenase (short-subunit alcohol dehydrogenase family)
MAHPRAPKKKGPVAGSASPPLQGRVAVVAGATRGAGRGIARALGEAGATVYCTGRSVRGRPSAYQRPETIEETAEMVTAAGGRGIAVRVDHTEEAEVRALFARVAEEQGRLDVVADSVAGEDPLMGGWNKTWETDLQHGPQVLRQTVFAHLLTAKHALAALVPRRAGLLVEVTDSDFLMGGSPNALADMAKSAYKAMVVRLAGELRPHRVAAVAVSPGFLRSETMLEHFGVTEATWREGGRKDPHFLHSESPLARSGEITSSWELAAAYGFTDADGSRPDWGAHITAEVVPGMAFMRVGLERQLALLEAHAARTRRYLGGVPARPPARRRAQKT